MNNRSKARLQMFFVWPAVIVICFSTMNFTPERHPHDGISERIELGRHFFYDKRLSESGFKSCSSCHDQRYAFSDGYRTSLGAKGESLLRNALPLFNLDSLKVYTWADSNITDLKSQMQLPLFNKHPVEMAFIADEKQLSRFLEQDTFYRKNLLLAFPDKKQPYSKDEVMTCIVDFMLQLQSYKAPYDHFQVGENALTLQEETGRELFFSVRLGCTNCHEGNNFSVAYSSKNSYFNTGVIYASSNQADVDSGFFKITRQKEDIGKFRVPTLRNLAFTAPYMHDGSLQTLSQVLEHYQHIGEQKHKLLLASELKVFTLSVVEKKALIAFLFSLSDSSFVIDKRFSNPFIP